MFEGDENVAGAGEADGVAVLLQQALGAEDDIEGGLLLDAARALGAAVVAAMAGVEDDGADRRGVLDLAGTHDGLDDLGDVHCGDEDFPALLADGEAEDVFDVVDENLPGSRLAADGLSAARNGEGLVVFDRRIEAVELGDILNGNVAASLVNDDVPGPRGERKGEQDGEEYPGERTHDA